MTHESVSCCLSSALHVLHQPLVHRLEWNAGSCLLLHVLCLPQVIGQSHMLHCIYIIMYYNTLQYITIYNNIPQYVTIYNNIVQCVKIYYNTLPYVTIYYDALQYTTIYSNIIQYKCTTVCNNIVQYVTIYYNILRHYEKICIFDILPPVFVAQLALASTQWPLVFIMMSSSRLKP